MNVYVYNAALFCFDCGHEIIEMLDEINEKDTGDSDDYPQGPYPNGGGESDYPQHCDNLDCGVFLENPLTTDGQDYVRACFVDAPSNPIVAMWADYYVLGAIVD